ncbi:unnamed protein product [Polarella glacialis]|uniref:Uncharacterized protein n=1 Tax=Polarella glacialis TaxID=89957 RepID=A0A813LPV5_POLGL|nr:unnamed protein product [Polarella glacialis]
MREAWRSWAFVKGQPAEAEMLKLLELTLRRIQLSPEVCHTKEAKAANLEGTTFNLVPCLFHLVAQLQRSKRHFAVIFRSFGIDHQKIHAEWNSFCELKHPVFSKLIEDLGPMDGTVPGIPDRRIHSMHTLYRDEQGPLLILDTCTNGPEDNSWDAWVRAKQKPTTDTREGRKFCQELCVETVDGLGKFQEWMQAHLHKQATGSIKDDWAWWQFHGETAQAGKLLTLFGSQQEFQQIFFDDNVELNNARIVDCRDPDGNAIPHSESVGKLCCKVNPVEAMLDTNYFLCKLLASQGDPLNVGPSLTTMRKQMQAVEEEKLQVQKQLSDVEEQKLSLQTQLDGMRLQLIGAVDEIRRTKLQNTIDINEEAWFCLRCLF